MSAGEAAMKAAAAAPTKTPADVDRYRDRDLAGRLTVWDFCDLRFILPP
ncbi:hypothetical protein [Streptomyces sp. NPDC050548]